MLCLRALVDYSFRIKGKVGKGRLTSLSFLSRHHGPIISSSSRLCRGGFFCFFFFCLYLVKLGSQIIGFYVCTEQT